MHRRMPGSMRTRHEFSDLIGGRLSSPDASCRLIGLARQLIIEEALEAETRDGLGRGRCGHGGGPGRGHGNGIRIGGLRTAEVAIECTAPQVAGGEEPFGSRIHSELKGNTERLETPAQDLLVRALSVREMEDAFRDEPPPGSWLTPTLWALRVPLRNPCAALPPPSPTANEWFAVLVPAGMPGVLGGGAIPVLVDSSSKVLSPINSKVGRFSAATSASLTGFRGAGSCRIPSGRKPESGLAQQSRLAALPKSAGAVGQTCLDQPVAGACRRTVGTSDPSGMHPPAIDR